MNREMFKQLGFLYFECATCMIPAKFCDNCRLSEVIQDMVEQLKKDALPEVELL